MKEQKLDKNLVKVLACPICKASVEYDEKEHTLTCKKCKKVYEIREGIPVMLPDE